MGTNFKINAVFYNALESVQKVVVARYHSRRSAETCHVNMASETAINHL